MAVTLPAPDAIEHVTCVLRWVRRQHRTPAWKHRWTINLLSSRISFAWNKYLFFKCYL